MLSMLPAFCLVFQSRAAVLILSCELLIGSGAGLVMALGMLFGVSRLWHELSLFFWVKQKTAYAMRISDWSSDVCSSDLKRLQRLFVAVAFGAFFEGAAGFGTPVAVTAAMLMGLGFAPLQAAGLSLIANTAPVAYGALGAPVIALSAVSGIDLLQLSGMIGRQLPFFSVIVPSWLIWAFAGRRGTMEVWPALLVAGLSFAIPQYLVSNFHGPWLVDVVAAICSMLALAGFLRLWQPKRIWTSTGKGGEEETPAVQVRHGHSKAAVLKAWLPWLILSIFVFLWGTPQFRAWLDALWVWKVPVPYLHHLVVKVPPVVAEVHAEAAVYTLNLLSATGTGIVLSAIVDGGDLGLSPRRRVTEYLGTARKSVGEG